MSTAGNSSSRPSGVLGFVALQLLLLSAAVAATAHRTHQAARQRALPQARRQPLQVAPLYDYPEVVGDQQLRRVLTRLRPRLRGPEPKINHVDHALRLWGVEARFHDPDCLSGQEMRGLLLNHRRFAEVWGAETRPLMVATGRGVEVRVQEGFASASHVDHTVAGLAEVGTPLDYPLQLATGKATLRDLLAQSLRDFSLNQVEYEWSALAYALYLQPTRRWFSSEGQEITFDRLSQRIMRQPLNQGVCYGHHRLHTLTMLLRVNQLHPILSDQAQQRIVAHLRDATSRLVRHQHVYGYWDRNWPHGPPSQQVQDGDGRDPIQKRMLATGHALEWWALAPTQVHPPREVLVRGGQWLCRTIDEMDDQQIQRNYTYLTHAGRALALWRGHFPAHFLPLTTADQQDPAASDAAARQQQEAAVAVNVGLRDGSVDNQNEPAAGLAAAAPTTGTGPSGQKE